MARGRHSPMTSRREALLAHAAKKAAAPRTIDFDHPYAVSVAPGGQREYWQNGLFYGMDFVLLNHQPDRAPPETGTPGLVTIGRAPEA